MRGSLFIAIFALSAGLTSAGGPSPVTRVVGLIKDLEAKVMSDGKAEQASYDEYACWCEKTLQRKAADISSNKETISETETLIKKLKGEIASHGAEIDQLNKDIAQNKEAQKDATAVRDKEYADYAAEKTESEQCIGALEAAITVLTGAGTKASFLGQMQEVKLMSVVAGVSTAISKKPVSDKVSDADMQLMQHFVSKPSDFFPARGGMIAAQTGNNPFGDYAPQSTQIQGILKGMYDAFTAELEKDNLNEADSTKAFEELMATKAKELATLEATLAKQESDKASKEKNLAESETLLDDTVESLKANEAFFADTKDACETKAKEWSVRTRLRTEELAGMQEAIKILSDGSGKFDDAFGESFLQLKSIQMHSSKNAGSTATRMEVARSHAYTRLSALAAQHKNRGLAAIAVEVKSAGHFDKVIAMIDEMMVILRKEEQEDIEHRDRCENGQNGNKNELEDLSNSIQKTQDAIKRLENSKKGAEEDLDSTKGEIKNTQDELDELLDFRNKESKAFIKALKDDSDAVDLLNKALKALAKFYKNNKASLAQKAPEYTEDPDKAPETTWSGSDYGGRKSENTGIVAIMEMLVEDLEKEMADGRADDASAQEKYLEQKGALDETMKALEATKVSLEEEIAELAAKIDDAEKHEDALTDDKDSQKDMQKALATDCSWVATHFQERRDKRKLEMDGLVDAKAALAEGNNR